MTAAEQQKQKTPYFLFYLPATILFFVLSIGLRIIWPENTDAQFFGGVFTTLGSISIYKLIMGFERIRQGHSG